MPVKDKKRKKRPLGITRTVGPFNEVNTELQVQRTQLKKELAIIEENDCEQLKEYKTAITTILEIHRKRIVTDASQVLIILLENYIEKLSTPLVSCSFLDDKGSRNQEYLLAKHCIALLKPTQDAANTGDECIYHLLKYLNLYHDKLDMRQGIAQLLCAFFSSYKHYVDGLSEELTKQLRIHDIWNRIIYTRWIHPAIIDTYDKNNEVRQFAFKKLSAVAHWEPKNQIVYQKYLTQIILSIVQDRTVSSNVKAIMLKHLGFLKAWIEPSFKGEIIRHIIAYLDHANLDLKFAAQRALRELMEDKSCVSQIDEEIDALLKRRERISLLFGAGDIVIYRIASILRFLCDFASFEIQAKLMALFADEFLHTSNRAVEELFFHLLNELHLTIPTTIQNDVVKKIVRVLSYDEKHSFFMGDNYKDFCEALIRIKNYMSCQAQENLCYEVFKYFLTYDNWDNIAKAFTKFFPEFIGMMSTEKRVQFIEEANAQLLVEFDIEQNKDLKSFYLWNNVIRRNTIHIITVLIASLPNKTKIHTQFFDTLVAISMERDEYYETQIDAEEALKKVDWHLSNESQLDAIDNLFVLANSPQKASFALKLIVHLSFAGGKETCNPLNDRLLALFHKKHNPLLKRDIVQSLANLQAMTSNNVRIVVAESLIDFLNKPKKKKIIRKEIITFIEQEQKRSPLPIYETAIPVLANIIKQKTKHTHFQIAACHALCQFSASICEPIQKEKVTVVLIDTIRDTINLELWQALCQTIVALKDWLLPDQKTAFMSYLVKNISNTTQINLQYLFIEALFTLRDWLADDALLEAELNNLLDKLDFTSEWAYVLLDKLMLILNEHEGICVIHHLIANLEHCKLYLTHHWLAEHAKDLNANDKISVLAHLERVSSYPEDNQANKAKSCFITTHKLYSQDITDELLLKEVDKYHVPVEITQYIFGYT